MKLLKFLFKFRIKLNYKDKSLFGKLIPISYLLNNDLPKLDLNKISNILYINNNISIENENIITNEQIYSTVHKFLFSISYKNEKILYITFNIELKQIDLIINVNFFN